MSALHFKLTLVAILSMLPAVGLAGTSDTTAAFSPDITKLTPTVRENFDLDLLMAGKPADRFSRAMQLKGTLPALSALNPMHDTEQVLSWLAVTALLESAVREAGSSETWDLELSGIYRAWSQAESTFRTLRSAMALVAFQHGNQAHPLVTLSVQLVEVPAYARRGFRWIAKRRLSGADKKLRPLLLEGLVEVNRREAQYRNMWMAAKSLSDLKPSGRHAAFEAEALFEMDKLAEAEKALARAEKDAKPEDLAQARNRKLLAEVRKLQSQKPGPENLVAIGKILLALDEPWRVEQALTADQVVKAANSELDEVFVRAHMRSGLNYESAWNFAIRARGKPATRPFLAHRIGAGLMMVIRQFYSRTQGLKLNQELIARIQVDLTEFRPADPRLADLTSLYLDFLRFISVQDTQPDAGKTLREAVMKFNRSNPADLAGVQMAYLLAQLDRQGPDPWEVLERYFKARGNREAMDVLPVYAGAAVRKSLKTKKPGPVEKVLGWIDKLPAKSKSMSLGLWKAHLTAVQAMLVEDKEVATRLREATNLFGEYIQTWSNSSEEARGAPEELCDAAVSLAVLLMQGQAADQGRYLLKQIEPVCGSYPPAVAVLAIMDLAEGKQAAVGQPDPQATLEEVIPKLFSEQAKLQARLWLAVSAEAAGESSKAKQHFQAAAESVRSEEARGIQVPLAPDRRSLVAFSGAFNMGAGYTESNPFGLTIEVNITTRMALFPPAAVDAGKLKPYLRSKGSK